MPVENLNLAKCYPAVATQQPLLQRLISAIDPGHFSSLVLTPQVASARAIEINAFVQLQKEAEKSSIVVLSPRPFVDQGSSQPTMPGGRSGPNGLAITVVEEELPFDLSNVAGELAGGRFATGNGLAQVDEGERVPIGGSEMGRCAFRLLFNKLSSLLAEWTEHGMLPDAMEPVFRVAVVGLAAVHDAVPVAAIGGANVLADAVRLVQKVMSQPKCR
jgi:hypothetical protein